MCIRDRPVTLACGGLKNTEGMLSELVHNTVAMDQEQGGFTVGAGAVGRVFVLWTTLVYRLLVLRKATYTVFVDLASFFDTISAQLTAAAAVGLGLPRLVGE